MLGSFGQASIIGQWLIGPDNNDGFEAINRLGTVETVSVEIDGQNWGTATSEPSPSIGYDYITSCIEDVRGQ